MENERYVLVKTGKGRTLQWTREPLPEPGAGEVRVKIVAAGVAFSDHMRLQGTYDGGGRIPYTPGWDLAGVVDAIGAGVTGWQPGQSVVALTATGNFARYRTVRADQLIAMPTGVDPAEAVSLGLNYVTAYQMLHRFARAKAGETVLVHGAAGGVGTAALQLGRIAELELYGIASQGHLETVTSAGAVAIDRTSEDFVQRMRALPGGGADIVLDGIGGDVLPRSFRVLRPGGRLISFGVTALVGVPPMARMLGFMAQFSRLAWWNALPNGKVARFYNIGGVQKKHPEWIREDLTRLLDWLRQRRIAPVIAERLPLIKAPQALEQIAAGKVQGKIVLMCQE